MGADQQGPSAPEGATTRHVRVLRPAEGVLAFYDGRVPGYRFAAEDNWVDVGALSLGTASYAILDGGEALVYDTHISPMHGRLIRRTLDEAGARRIRVLLSHWHLDHVAGTEAFADCEVIATERTAARLGGDREAIEAGTLEGPPAISPLALPDRTFAGELELRVGSLSVRALHLNVHTDDAAVLWLPGRRLLLAGDTVEDTVTYVDEPQDFPQHLRGLDRLRELQAEAVLPNHGDPEVIASGGYRPGILSATQDYIRALQRCVTEPRLRQTPLRELLRAPLAAGDLRYFAAYEDVHHHNVRRVLERLGDGG